VGYIGLVQGARMQPSWPHASATQQIYSKRGEYGKILRRLTRSIISKLKGRWRSFTCTENRSLVLWWANTMIPISDYNGDLYPVLRKHKIDSHIIHFSICRSTLILRFTPVVKLEWDNHVCGWDGGSAKSAIGLTNTHFKRQWADE
jgi:hypothetical protein